MRSKTVPTFYTKVWVDDDGGVWHGEIWKQDRDWSFCIISPDGKETKTTGYASLESARRAANACAIIRMGRPLTKS